MRRPSNITQKRAPMNHRRRRVAIPTIAGLAAAACLTFPASVANAADSCSTTRATDINGDGYDDAVVGDPYATVAAKPRRA